MPKLSHAFKGLKVILSDGKLQGLPDLNEDGYLYLPAQHIIIDIKPTNVSDFKIDRLSDGSILIEAPNGESVTVKTELDHYREDLFVGLIEQHEAIYTSKLSDAQRQFIVSLRTFFPKIHAQDISSDAKDKKELEALVNNDEFEQDSKSLTTDTSFKRIQNVSPDIPRIQPNFIQEDPFVIKVEKLALSSPLSTLMDPILPSIENQISQDQEILYLLPNKAIITPITPSVIEGSISGQFLVDLGDVNNTGAAITLLYSLSGSANAGSDYTALSGSVVIAKGQQTATISLLTLDDVLFENNESVQVTLASSSNSAVAIDATPAVVTLVDNDNGAEQYTATVTANDASAAEAGPDNGQFTVDLGVVNNTGGAITLTYTVAGTATGGSDYTALSGSVLVANGQQTATIDVLALDDALFENNETVQITLASSSDPAVAIDATPAVVMLADDDNGAGQYTATVVANDASASEAGPDNGQFTVDLGVVNNTGGAITLTYTVAGTATGGSDYTALSGSVVVANGQQTATIDVLALDDALLENNETVQVTLASSSDPAVVVDVTPALVTISDDESPTATVTANDPNAAEAGPDNGQFTVDLGVVNNTGGAITLTYTVAGSATAGSDYTALSGSVVIANGQQTATIDVLTIDDSVFENNETVQVTLASSSDPAVAVDGTPAVVTITDDEPILDLDMNDSTAVGNAFATTFTEVGTGGPSVAIADTDADITFASNLTGATITLVAVQAGDLLVDSTGGSLPGGITASAFAGGVITLSGTASVSDYADAIALIHFQNTGDDPSVRGTALSRTVNITVTDGSSVSNVAVATVTIAAENDAPSITVGGVANITGQLPSFSSENTISNTQDSVRYVTTGDIDGDGDLDVLSASLDDDTIAWFANDGSGNFGPENTISNAQDEAHGVTAADIDGDGDLDVITASGNDDTVAWFENTNGMGTFGAENTISSTQDRARLAVAADLDGDSDLDVISISSFDHTVAWFENTDGAGSFGAENTISSTQFNITSVAIADVDGDGDLDVLTASYDDDTVAWFANDGAGNFGAENTISSTQDGAFSVAVGDIDGDGDIDVLSASDLDGTVAWFANDGAGNFGAENTISNTQNSTSAVTAADIDGDGDLDVISSAQGSDTIAWFANDGAGNFGGQNTISNTQDSAFSVTTGDLDGDGDLDVISGSLDDDTVAWFENESVYATYRNVPLTFSAANNNAIVVLDADTNSLTTTLTVMNGTLSATASGSATIMNNGTASIQVDGSVADINATLDGLVYTPTMNYVTTQASPETIVIVVNDNGNTGSGGAMMDMETVNIRVAPTAPPVVIDMDGDGVEFIGLPAGYQFDMNGDELLNQTAWAGADDAILVYDQDGDGKISGPGEFQFIHYLEGATTDLEGLNYFDDNSNGKLDVSDSFFSAFHLWQDINLSGTVEKGEWISVIDAGIQFIGLESDEKAYQAAGGDVIIHGTTQVQFLDGSMTTAADAEFRYIPNVESKPGLFEANPSGHSDAPSLFTLYGIEEGSNNQSTLSISDLLVEEKDKLVFPLNDQLPEKAESKLNIGVENEKSESDNLVVCSIMSPTMPESWLHSNIQDTTT